MALARSPLALSFVPSKHGRPRSGPKRQQVDGEDFYEAFLQSQINEIQNKVDDIDYEYITLTRDSLDQSEHVKTLEASVTSLVESTRKASADSLEQEKLNEMVKTSLSKLTSARSQLMHTLVSKSERLKRLEAYKKELEEREVLLHQHQNKQKEEEEWKQEVIVPSGGQVIIDKIDRTGVC